MSAARCLSYNASRRGPLPLFVRNRCRIDRTACACLHRSAPRTPTALPEISFSRWRHPGSYPDDICALAFDTLASATPNSDGELRIEVVDSVTAQPIAARMHLYMGSSTVRRPAAVPAVKRPVKLNLPATAEFGGHFYVDGKISLPLRIGAY